MRGWPTRLRVELVSERRSQVSAHQPVDNKNEFVFVCLRVAKRDQNPTIALYVALTAAAILSKFSVSMSSDIW